ncbi:hypothetical protein V5O48_012165 [Marasmius crinis-equi]|uniref:CxC1-like cysteine cluster associated with KDZ transposases domain-containing protein n=1 Tax=Marasmius crinis-equi TaxID=585013 RepID=A0ABR3F3L4_9AGAR
MSRPRVRRGFVASQPSEIPLDYSLQRAKRPHLCSLKNPPLVYLANGQVFTQDPNLPTKTGQVGVAEPLQGNLPSTIKKTKPTPENENDAGEEVRMENEAIEHWTPHLNKRNKQSQRWMTDVIPQLVLPYMKLLRVTEKLHQDPEPQFWPCCCGGREFRMLNITVVRFARLSEMTLQVCECTSAGAQLVAMGLFPSAPCYPTLAVDIRVLEFVEGLFLRVAPNHRAWCDTVTDFLDNQGYRMKGKDPLRRRFSNAYQWYSILKLTTREHIDDMLSECRIQLSTEPEPSEERSPSPFSSRTSRPASPSSCYEYPPESSPPSSRPSSRLEGLYEDQWDAGADEVSSQGSTSSRDENESRRKRPRVDETPTPLDRPSEYLRRRCPLCFGGWDPDGISELDFHAIVCIDACFTQKHNKTRARDPPKEHPNSAFLNEEELRSAEEYVETLRPSAPKSKQATDEKDSMEEEDDGYKGSMKVPRSALKGCHESFTAADERRQKASTQFFDCTGLMGLLCRHDRVLWLANMTSAGEKQFYVIALLKKLFQHLPESFTIGLLYDIGCQLDSSCDKWGFLEDFRDRLGFAISVFHAFGHHWACQLVYHPRKRKGFGLSDGEGCERFWHSISRLIPYLRVCGYYQHLYTLDAQVTHDDRESLKDLGAWLARKLSDARGAEIEGQREMEASGRTEAFLRDQWEAQKAEQTKPLPKKSNLLGKKAVQEVMRLRTSLDLLEQKRRELEDVVMNLDVPDWRHDEAVEELPEIQVKVVEARKKLRAKEHLLGVKDSQAAQHLQDSPFLRERMRALALKNRLVALIRARKFQRDRLERSFRKNSNEAKLHSQIAHSMKRKDPSIQKVVRSYNTLVKKLREMIERKKCPRNATAPREIPMDKLFALDMDDKIWEDVGLTDEWDRPDLPPWLADDQIARLRVERDAMQAWFAEEWAVVHDALNRTSISELDVRYQLSLRKVELLKLCIVWQAQTNHFRPSPNVPEWGPTTQELEEAKSSMTAELLEEERYRPTGVLNKRLVDEIRADEAWEEADEDDDEDVEGVEYDEDGVNTIETFDIVDDNDTFGTD